MSKRDGESPGGGGDLAAQQPSIPVPVSAKVLCRLREEREAT